MNTIKDWLANILGGEYAYVADHWEERHNAAADWLCVVAASGGPAPVVDIRRRFYSIMLIGPRNMQQATNRLKEDADQLVNATIRGERPCGYANARCTGEPMGPGFTVEDRAWMQLNLELTL